MKGRKPVVQVGAGNNRVDRVLAVGEPVRKILQVVVLRPAHVPGALDLRFSAAHQKFEAVGVRVRLVLRVEKCLLHLQGARRVVVGRKQPAEVSHGLKVIVRGMVAGGPK